MSDATVAPAPGAVSTSSPATPDALAHGMVAVPRSFILELCHLFKVRPGVALSGAGGIERLQMHISDELKNLRGPRSFSRVEASFHVERAIRNGQLPSELREWGMDLCVDHPDAWFTFLGITGQAHANLVRLLDGASTVRGGCGASASAGVPSKTPSPVGWLEHSAGRPDAVSGAAEG